ncbi:DNA polymerase III subunit gamma/tau [Hahella sp. KA22]|uniref:DNA polymerase III subunit gamma/tau n=1 Tax=Hahella sp. KA22 TaxID=1628392 RepID=UPI000FDD221C|nr:DNA polymerase III subunit gamma/tau [Hahella sp. KA22]AZZ93088.1 DNA polymerase III subunit gamma/tau [Hahella sp. KA22]QAY56462.1 DNA polymerase III subunit gamma/tau [Hahella sp. KA22]
MAYQVLARKWRPGNFAEMAGQEHVLKALTNALNQDRLHHAYLFTGTRGVGKTTVARIFAKCLNCEQGVSAIPCGECGVCREIAEGRFVDLIEIDAASRTKVEDMRELLDNVQYAPTRSRYKIYLIDEVHMLSNSSFNALLKTLEEPPPHVKFLLATTDPQKLPVTILSRCLQFNLKNLSPQRIVSHLTHVLQAENVPAEEAALWELARAAEGSMRDAMSLTDQAIAFGDGKLAAKDVIEMLGTIEKHVVIDLLRTIAAQDCAAMLAQVNHMAQFAPDYAYVLQALAELLHRVAVEQAVPGGVDNSFGDQQQVAELAQTLTAEDTQLYYQIALMGRKDLALAPDPRTGFEMALLRMIAFRPNIKSARQIQAPSVASATASAEDDKESAQPRPSQTESTVASQPAVESAPEPAKEVAEPQQQTPQEPAEPSPQEPPRQEIPQQESLQPKPHNQADAPVIDAAPVTPAQPVEQATPRHSEAEPPPVDDYDAYFADDPGPSDADYGFSDYPADSGYDSEGNHVAPAKPPQPHGERPRATAPIQEHQEQLAREAVAPHPKPVTESGLGPQTSPGGAESVNSAPPVVTATSVKKPPTGPLTPPLEGEPTMQGMVWKDAVRRLGISGMTATLAQRCALEAVTPGLVIFTIDREHLDFFNEAQRERLRAAVSEFLGEAVKIEVSAGESKWLTPLQYAERRRAELQQQAETAIRNDPNIQMMAGRFGAAVIENSIEPIIQE